MINGIDVRVDYFWPKNKPNGTETIACRAHPFVEWLARFFPFDPNTYFQVPKYTWADPVVIKDNGREYMVMSPEQFHQIKTEIRDRKAASYWRAKEWLMGGKNDFGF